MFFLESPWPTLIAGLAIEMALAIALFKSGRGKLLLAMAGVAVLVLAGLLIEHFAPTDTKKIRQTLESTAAALVANDAEKAYPYIVPGPDGGRARELVVWALSRAEFTELSIRNLDVKFNYRTSPPTADTSFTVWVSGRDKSGFYPGDVHQPVAMTVKLRRESGRWLIYGEPTHDVRE
jgi:hypothetical protein